VSLVALSQETAGDIVLLTAKPCSSSSEHHMKRFVILLEVTNLPHQLWFANFTHYCTGTREHPVCVCDGAMQVDFPFLKPVHLLDCLALFDDDVMLGC